MVLQESHFLQKQHLSNFILSNKTIVKSTRGQKEENKVLIMFKNES